MIIKKIFNNNCVLADEDLNEVIVTGSGVGFQKKPGDKLDVARIEKKFELIDEYMENFELLVKRIPFDYFLITQKIVDKVTKEIKVELDTKIMVSLTDHISFAVARSNEEFMMPTLFEREMQLFYPEEYAIGVWAVELIDSTLGVKLQKEEASFIALHILNASSGTKDNNTARKVIKFVKDCIEIIEDTMNITIDRDSMQFQRIMTHLKFLGKYIIEKNVRSMPSNIEEITSSLLLRFSNTKTAVDSIKQYVKENYDFELSEDEYLYLSIHTYQVVNKTNRG